MGTPFIDNFCTQFRGQEKSELKFSTTVDLSMISVKDMYILCLDIYIYINMCVSQSIRSVMPFQECQTLGEFHAGFA